MVRLRFVLLNHLCSFIGTFFSLTDLIIDSLDFLVHFAKLHIEVVYALLELFGREEGLRRNRFIGWEVEMEEIVNVVGSVVFVAESVRVF